MSADRSEELIDFANDVKSSPRRRATVIVVVAFVVASAAVSGAMLHRTRARQQVAIQAATGVADRSDPAVGAPVASATTATRIPSVPQILSHVPSSDSPLPPEGVSVNGMLLLPAPPDALPSVSKSEALSLGAKEDSNPTVTISDALLATFTYPGSVPLPGSTEPPGVTANPIQDRLAWVVTVTAPQPVDVSQAPGATLLSQHNELVFDANTGSFMLGFFTP